MDGARPLAPGGTPAAARLGAVLTRPWLLWALTGGFALRAVVLNLLAPTRVDGAAFMAAGRAFLHHPQEVYAATAAALAHTGFLPVTGWLGPPAGAILMAPFALLPRGADLAAWTVCDAAAAVAGLALIASVAAPDGWRRPLFWLVAAYFPPLFADVDAGQLGGFLVLLTGAALRCSGRRPALAGALAGVAAGVKLYPAFMVLGAGNRLRTFGVGAVAVAAGVDLAGFLRPGMPSPARYASGVLLPALHSPFPDCAINSVPNLYARVVGGQPYALPGVAGLTWVRLPVHLPGLAQGLSIATILALVGAAVWAAWRSGWHPVYGPALALSLGALVPGEVNTDLFLPRLPIVLITLERAAEAGRWRALAAAAAALLGFARQPCYLPFPNLWTVAGLALFAICACQNDLFREPGRTARKDTA